MPAFPQRESQRIPSRSRRPNPAAAARALLAVAAIASAIGCGEEPRRSAAAPEAAHPATSAALTDPATLSSTNHDVYAQNGLTCLNCHECGRRSLDGHAATWMDRTSTGFHAFAANAGLASCQPCHGPALDGTGGTTTVACAACHGASWATNCTLCHGGTDGTSGAPPRTTWGKSGESVRVGAHTAHLAATHGLSTPVACASCHVVPASALSAGHADGPTATVTFGGLAVHLVPPVPGPAWDRAQATCTNVYCHGATLAGGTKKIPTWTATDGAARTCDACHGAPPPEPHVGNVDCNSCHTGYVLGTAVPATHIDGDIDVVPLACNTCHGTATNDAPPRGTRGETLTTALAVGAHQRHLSGGALSPPMPCTECHLVPSSNRHADGIRAMAWGPLATSGGAAPVWNRAEATCSSTYCHGTFQGGNAANAPAWTRVDGTQAACGTCHGAPPPGPHSQNPACERCHQNYTRNSVSLATHVNGSVQHLPLTCNSMCHGSAANAAPPAGTLGETDPTSRAVGAHQPHLAGGTLGVAVRCEECHAVPTDVGHADGMVEVVLSTVARTRGASPEYDPATMTCSGVYCHGAVLGGGANIDPLWTGGAGEVACGSCHGRPPASPHVQNPACERCHEGYSQIAVNVATHVNGSVDHVPLTCSTCHGSAANAAPPGGTRGETDPSARAVGAHQRHLSGGTLGPALACDECHPVQTDVLHADGAVQVVFRTPAPGLPTPSYDRDATRCSGVYCHGATLPGGTKTAPVWTAGPGEIACGTCHGAPPPPPHVASAITGCVTCHQESVDAAGNVKPAPLGAHLDGDTTGAGHDASWSTTTSPTFHAYSANQGLDACATCHGATLDGGTSGGPCGRCHDQNLPAGVASWKVNCVMCHGGTDNQTGAPPKATWGNAADTVRVGAHSSHLTAGVSCASCHPVPADVFADGHIDASLVATVTLPGIVGQPAPQWDRAAGTCTNTSCHGLPGGTVPTPVWTRIGEGQAACGACHGLPPPSPHVTSPACGNCHQGYTATTVNPLLHRNGVVDRLPQTCSSCHGSVANAAPPLGTRGETATTSRAVGAHQRHLAGSTLGVAVRCEECHAVPTDVGHADGMVEVAFSTVARTRGASPAYDPATMTCSGVYCHGAVLGGGANVDPLWTGGAPEVACGSCHGRPPASPHVQNPACERCHEGYSEIAVNVATHVNGSVDHVPLTCTTCHGSATNAAPPSGTRGETDPSTRAVGAHQRHLAGGTLGPALACDECHAVPTNVLHADGFVQVVFKTPPPGLPIPSYDRDAMRCSGVYCHGATLPGGTKTAPVWTAGSGETACGTCHGAPPPPPHVASAITGCVTCHVESVDAAGNVKPAPAGGHLDGVITGHGHGATWTQTTSTEFHAYSANQGLDACKVCHGATLDGGTSGGPCGRCHDQNLPAGVASWKVNCVMCHGGTDNQTGAPPKTTWGNAAETIRIGAHSSHLGAGVSCASCHTVPADVFAEGHIDASLVATVTLPGIEGAPEPRWDRTTGTCTNTACHGLPGGSIPAPVWTRVGEGQADCGACHGLPPTGSHVASPACGNCHQGYTATAVNPLLHRNGVVDKLPQTCSSCHGSVANAAPPLGTRGETETTSRAVGAHQQHLAGGTLRAPIDCAECHPVPTELAHRDGVVELEFGGLATTDGAVPSWDPANRTCSNYCHGAVLRGGGTNLAPVWTGGPSQVACGSCHLTPPPPPHPRTQICDNCHPGYTLTSVNPEKHINGVVNAENLTCSACHGDSSRVLVMQADPLAIAAPPYGSRGETDPASRSVGQHQAHVSRGDGIALPNKCSHCHAVPAPGQFDHSDGDSKVTFAGLALMEGATPTFDRTTNTCANTYCHGSTLGRGGTDHSPTWTNPQPVTCTTCHGAPPPLPHPQETDCIRCHPGYTQTSVRKWTHINGISDFPTGCNSCHDVPPNSGEHYEHLQHHVACDRCHSGYTTTSANPTLHRNAVQDVTLSGWNASQRTCSSISCHGSRYWGRTGDAARQSCNQCHGVPPASGEHFEHSEYSCSRCHGTGYSTTTNNPATHMNGVSDVPYAFYDRTQHSCSWGTGACHGSKSWGTPKPVTPNCSNCHGFPPPLPHPQQSACQSCHPSMLSTGVLTTSHNNGTLDISGAGCASCHGSPPATTRSGGAHPADANCYGCHATTVDSTNQIVPNGTHNDGAVQVGGGGVGTYGCQSCHGDQKRSVPAGVDPNAKAAPPLGTRGETETTTRAVGAHLAHLAKGAGAIAPPTACAECHVVPTAMDHANGSVVLTFVGRAALGGAVPRWNAGALTCSSTYCHGATLGGGGTNHEPSWVGGPEQAACGTCHGLPPPAPHTTDTSCGSCHDGYTATTVDVAHHVNGSVDVNSSACNACHGSASNAAPPRGTHGETLTTERAVGAHQSHLAAGPLAGAFACAECHVPPSSMAHVDGTARIEFGLIARTGGTPASFDTTSLTCSTYCHGATLQAGGSNHAPRWTTVDGSQVACGTCHGVPPPWPHPLNPSCGGCHDGYTETSVNLALHVDGRVEVGSLTCSSCHGSPVNAAPPTGLNGEAATTTIAVGAHQQHLQGGSISGPIACSECHVVPTDVGHADAAVQVAFGAVATSDGATPVWDRATASCSATYCHGQFVGGNLINEPSWTTVDGTQAICGSCHGAPPAPPHVQSDQCGACHDGYTASVVNFATHVDGRLDISPSTCNSCHGSAANAAPPSGADGETSETSRAVGAHQRHLTGGPLRGPMACTECHAVPTTTEHVDGTARLAFGALASTDGATPAWDGTSLTCSNYCHGAVLRGGGTNLSPVWTGGPSQATCGSCHGRPPPPPHPYTQICDNCHPGYTIDTVNPATHVNGLVESDNLTCSSCHGDNSRVLVMQADPLAIAAPPYGSLGQTDPASRSVGQHQAHVNRGDGIALPNKCRYCHAVPTTFDHSNGESTVTFDLLATMDGATPTFDRTTNTCSNTYCHGSTLGRGGTNHTPSWTNPQPVTCTTCHGAPPPPPHPQETDCIRCHPGYTQTSVRKWTHINGISDFPSGCNSCHDIPPNTGDHYDHLQRHVACDKCHAGYTTTSANPTLHRNGVQNVTVSGWNATQRTCSSNSCHGWTRYWSGTGDAARTSCNQCHGVPPASGQHFEHSEYSCSRCHGTGYSTTTNNPATHMNGVNDVPYAFYNRTTHSCSWGTGACHGSESWGTPLHITPNCSNCHGFPPPLPHPQQSACQSCHPSMLSTGVLTTDHNNGTLDIAGSGCASCHGFPPTSTRAGGVHPSDANCYGCHSSTVDAANEIVPNGTHNDGYVQVGGGGAGTYGCQSCHGNQARTPLAGTDPNVKAAPPLGTRGETEPTTRAVGAHLAHVSKGAGAIAPPAFCAECHVVPTSMQHANGMVLIAFGPRATANGAIALWNPETLTCATYCHGESLGAGGTNHEPSWVGGPEEAACGTCHDAPPPAPHTTNPSCGTCHPGYTQTTVDPTTHVDGILQSWSHPAGYAAATLHGRDANLQGFSGCASCHGADLNGGTAGVSCNACHAAAGFSTWTTNCTFCHGDTATGAQSPPVDIQGRSVATNVSVGAHASHVGTLLANPIGCGECHPARSGSVLADAAHVDGNGIAEVAFGPLATASGAAPTYARASDTSANCAATYCHGSFAGGANATVQWTSTEQVGCTSCHGAPPPAPHTTSTDCNSCHQGYTQTTVNRATHIDGVVQVTSPHPAGWASATSHGTTVNVSGLASCKSCHGADLNGGSGQSCGGCHATAGIAGWDTNCTFCHGSRTTVRANPPQDIRNGSTTTSVTVGVHENHVTSTIANVGCSECHPARTASVVTDAAHIDGNGQAEIAFGTIARTGNITPTYTRSSSTSATCASTYCHGRFTGGVNSGQGATMNFTSTTQVGCSSCHGNPPSTGDHGRHTGRSCGDCHGVGYTTSAVVKATHVNGTKQVGNRITSWNPSTKSCSSNCHGSRTW